MRALVECLGVTQTDASKASAGPADLPDEPDPARAKERFEVLFEQAGPDAPAAQPARHTSYTHLGPVAGPPEESGRNRPDVGVGDRRPPAVGFDLDQFRTPGTPARPAGATLDADHRPVSMALPHRPLPRPVGPLHAAGEPAGMIGGR